MQITIINDCRDQNAKLRQVSRTGSLFRNSSVSCFGIESDLEASGSLVDTLDGFEGREGVIMLNIAPRGGKAKKWKNGAPFGFFWYKKTLVVTSVDGLVLSLAKKIEVIKELYILDIPQVLDAINNEELDEKVKERILKSQFRSFDFLPRVACWLAKKQDIPFKKYDLSEIIDAPTAVWFIDNFGNVKTTLLMEELNIINKNNVKLEINNDTKSFSFYNRLSDLPDGETGLVHGSSGIGEKRFIEIMTRGGNAAKKLDLEVGSEIKAI